MTVSKFHVLSDKLTHYPAMIFQMNECSSVLSQPDLLRPSQPSSNGGQVLTLSPTAADGAGGAGDQPASSSAADLTGDAEGVWSADIDQAFQEALAIYPPCGRRKIIISDEGKMYGRNELIARYIKIRCGKTRTRKQVSSHIQVLARKKLRDDTAKKKAEQVALAPVPSAPVPTTASTSELFETKTQPSRVPAVPGFPSLPNLPIPDAKEQLKILQQNMQSLTQGIYNPFPFNPVFVGSFHPGAAAAGDIKPFAGDMKTLPYGINSFPVHPEPVKEPESPGEDHTYVESSSLRLNGFTAYVEGPKGNRVDIVSIPKYGGEVEDIKFSAISDKYPALLKELFNQGPTDAFYLAKCWANVQFTVHDASSLFAVDSYYTSKEKFDISVSTKVCSFGMDQVEKVEVYSPHEEHGQYSFRLEKSPMCDYMVKFIYKLKELESEEWMNNVLENFTVLQVITNKTTGENLMVLCFLFEVNREPDTTCSLFRLTPG